MKTPRTQIAQVVTDQVSSGDSAKQLAVSVAAYLLTEGRVGELDSLMRDVQAERAERGQVEVIATSAHVLDHGALATITACAKRLFPAAKHIFITEQRDPELIGGVKLQIVDYQTDMSVAGDLKQLRTLAMHGKDGM